MATDEDSELKNIFDKAAVYLRSIIGQLDSDKLLHFYARFKQATDGPCNVPRPGMFDFQGKKKWDAWKNLGDKSKKEAMIEYVEAMGNVDPDWEEKAGDCGSDAKKAGLGLSVSTMAREEPELDDGDKDVFDWCKEGNIHQVAALLRKADVNEKDAEGMALLHWACDRGLDEMVRVLIKHKANINIQDADGQTPLHYAASCDHEAVIDILLAGGADRQIRDDDGMTAREVAGSQRSIQLLQPT